MNYWIFIVSNTKQNGRTINGREIFERRMNDKFWGLGDKTPNRNNLKQGDNIVFYIAYPETIFAGEATLNSKAYKLTLENKQKLSYGNMIFNSDYGIELKDIKIWNNSVLVRSIVQKLNFIENKEYWFTYFQGGVRQITENDYLTIQNTKKSTLVENIISQPDLESASDFALESHLEEFIFENWDNINWGYPLKLYQTDEQNGRQFPAGLWSIDFLAKNQKTNELFVIELKRGKTSDSTVGQTLRYINWVKENICEDNQNVRGIIIAKDVDESLKYAIKGLQNIEVRNYSINFNLKNVVI